MPTETTNAESISDEQRNLLRILLFGAGERVQIDNNEMVRSFIHFLLMKLSN